MLRFVQGIHKAFRSNQAYAPCQKAAHDQDEFEARPADNLQQKKSFNSLASLPLSQEPSYCAVPNGTIVAHRSAPCIAQSVPSSKQESDYHSNGHGLPHGILPGALFGAGYAVLNTVHAYCSGRKGSATKDRSKCCPVTQAQGLRKSSALLRSLTNLFPGSTYGVSQSFSVLPKSDIACEHTNTASEHSKENLSIDSSASGNQASALLEFEKARDEVNNMADNLCQVDQEHFAVDHFLAMRAWNNKDFSLAAGLWQRTVDKFATGMAAHRLGVCYEKGHGVSQSYELASEYYRQAVEHGCAKAMYRQALLQMNGHIQEEGDSLDLMKQAAELNNFEAQTFLGSFYFHKGNRTLAVKYYQRAAAQDYAEACYYLGVCYETGAVPPCADDSKAAEFYRKAAEGGHADAQYNLAVFYEEGCGSLNVDHQKSIYWLKKSAKQGNISATEQLNRMGSLNIMIASTSLPTFSKHLTSTLTDLSIIPDVIRAQSHNALATEKAIFNQTTQVAKSVSRASSASSLATGTPQFYLPAEGEDDDNWSDDEGLSSASSDFYLDHQDKEFSAEPRSFNLDEPDPAMHSYRHTNIDSWSSLSSLSDSSLCGPHTEDPQIIFT